MYLLYLGSCYYKNKLSSLIEPECNIFFIINILVIWMFEWTASGAKYLKNEAIQDTSIK